MLTVSEAAVAESLEGLTGLRLAACEPIRSGLENRSFHVISRTAGPLVCRLSRSRSVSEVMEEIGFISACRHAGVCAVEPVGVFRGEPLIQAAEGVWTAFRYVVPDPCPPAQDEAYRLLVPHVAGILTAGQEIGAFTHRRPRLPTPQDQARYLAGLCSSGRLDAAAASVIHTAPASRSRAAVPAAVHGDIHPGNVIWVRARPVILDFDDAYSGSIQDEVLSFARGYCFLRGKFLAHLWRSLRSDFPGLIPQGAEGLVLLWRTCLYFAAAIAASPVSSQQARAEADELEKLRALSELIDRG